MLKASGAQLQLSAAGEQAGRGAGGAGHAIDPDLAVDVVRPVYRADGVVQCWRPLQVGPADVVGRRRRHLIRAAAGQQGCLVPADNDVVVTIGASLT